jgi:DNA-binding protein Fis
MEIQKQFSFVGNLKKLHEDDNQPIENFSADIQCHKNGDIFLEIDLMIYRELNYKRFYETTQIYKFVNTPEFTEDEMADPFFLLQLDGLEEELVQEPYEGEYIIEGKTVEGWMVKAKIAEQNFTISFKNEDQRGSVDDIQNYLIRLSNLYIDYHPDCTEGRKIEVVYGFSSLDLIHKSISTQFLDSKYELNLSLIARNDKNTETLGAEMILRAIEDNCEEIPYNTYFAWFELLISFATGKCLKEVYRIETIQFENKQKKVEFWSGSQIFRKGGGIAVIQQAYLPLFIQQCASKVTWNNFSDKGLGSALRWYTESFTSSTVSVQFILLCTVLETLNKHHSSESSSRLIPKSVYKEIRRRVLEILNEYEQSLDGKEVTLKYRIFKAKVEQSFGSSFNQIGNLRTSLEEMLEFYQTPYKDLFPNLEFIKIRNDLVHTGFGGDNIFPELRKLGNLVVGLVLSILQYQGNYVESRRVELGKTTDFVKYDLAYKTFPFEDEP